MFRCFCIPSERKVKNKGDGKSCTKENFNAAAPALAKLQNSRVPHQKSSRFNVESPPVKAEVVEEAYEAEEDENEDDSPLIKREVSDFGKDWNAPTDKEMKDEGSDELEDQWFGWVDAWVKDLQIQQPLPPEDDDIDDDDDKDRNIAAFPQPSPDAAAGKTMKTSTSDQLSLLEEILNAINPASSVARISGVGIQVIPVISHLSNLRSLYLSNNFIVSISPGCLPKSIHTLDLSRNNITTIHGLTGLTRLQLLDLSYNRISTIGQGLLSCTLIKELYLSGNKISDDVEGLHRRLFKLTVLDLSFNKITTTKALAHLVPNYNSIQSLNLLGNPIQTNISHQQLKKAVSRLLPNLTYLNKQPLKPQRPRQILTDSLAKPELGNINRSSGRSSGYRSGVPVYILMSMLAN